jgi:hypothetical protein
MTPELAKFAAAHPGMLVIRDFIEWCNEQHIELAVPTPSGRYLQPVIEGLDTMLSRYFEIDTAKLEEERRALLASAGTQRTFDPTDTEFDPPSLR